MQELDVVIQGKSLEDFGFMNAFNVISGVALNTFGFINLCDEIWDTAEPTATTVWSNVSISTSVETCQDE